MQMKHTHTVNRGSIETSSNQNIFDQDEASETRKKSDAGAEAGSSNMEVEFTPCLVFGKWSSKGPCHPLAC